MSYVRVERLAAVAVLFVACVAGSEARAMGLGGSAPVVDRLEVSPSPVTANGTATISCAATGSSVVRLTVSASGGTVGGGASSVDLAIAPGPSVSGSTAWSTPGPGPYAVTCTAESPGAFGSTLTASRTLAVDVVAASLPAVDAVLGPTGPVPAGTQIALSVVARDPAGGSLFYAWSASAGSVQGTGASATWLAPTSSGRCTISVAVSDSRGGTVTASLDVDVALAFAQGALVVDLGVPLRVGVGARGELYVVEGRSGDVLLLTPRGSPMASLHLPSKPLAVAPSPYGLFVSTVDGRVVRFDPSTTRAGAAFATGVAVGPVGMAYEPSRGLLWVAEKHAGQVRALRPDGTEALRIASAGTTPLVAPAAVAVDASTSTVWVLESSPSGSFAHAFSADGAYLRSSAPAGSGEMQLTRPSGIAAAGGRLYVADAFQGNVKVYGPAGEPLGAIGRFGGGPGDLRQPADVGVLPGGDVVVANLDAGRLERFSAAPGTPPPACAGDSDCDGLPDGWEIANGLSPYLASDALADPDGDGLTNLQELLLGTNPRAADTDGDGFPDGEEVASGFDPLDPNDHRPSLVASGPERTPPGLVRISASLVGRGSCAIAWRQVEGAPVRWLEAEGLEPRLVARAAGRAVVRGVAACGGAQSLPADVAFEVLDVPPVLDAGRARAVHAGESVSFDGSLSSDANGGPVALEWSQTLGPALVPATPGPLLDVHVQGPGLLAFELAARDGDGRVAATAEVPVLVLDSGKAAAEIAVAAPSSAAPGETVVLDASGTASDRPLRFAWRQIDGPPVELDGAGGATASFVAGAPGRHVFEVNAFDGARPSMPARAEVRVRAEGRALPVARAEPPAAAAVGAVVLLDGSASSAGSGLSYEWRQVSGPAAGLTDRDRAVATVVAFAPGVHAFELVVRDGEAESAPARVTVAAGSVPLASARAPATARENETVALEGAAAGASGAAYAWTQVGGPWVPIDGATSAAASFRPRAPGLYRFELEVTASGVRSAPASAAVLVFPRGQR